MSETPADNPSGIALDRGAVGQLSAVAASIAKLDEFNGFLASVSMTDDAFQSINARWTEPWESVYNCGRAWYGLMGNPSDNWRDRSIKGLFDPFDAQDTAVNCIAPLAALAQLEDEILAAGGAATPYQVGMVRAKLDLLNTWLTEKSSIFDQGFTFLKARIADVEGWPANISRTLALYNAWPSGSVSAPVIQFANAIIQKAETMDAPSDILTLAWTTVQSMVTGTAARLDTAAGCDVGSMLQSLNIKTSLNEWPVLCELAQRFRPGPPPPIPPPPFGLA